MNNINGDWINKVKINIIHDLSGYISVCNLISIFCKQFIESKKCFVDHRQCSTGFKNIDVHICQYSLI